MNARTVKSLAPILPFIQHQDGYVYTTSGAGSVWIPAIDFDLTVVLDYSASNPIYTVSGAHDGLPNYELYIASDRAYEYDVHITGTTPFDRTPPMDRFISPPRAGIVGVPHP